MGKIWGRKSTGARKTALKTARKPERKTERKTTSTEWQPQNFYHKTTPSAGGTTLPVPINKAVFDRLPTPQQLDYLHAADKEGFTVAQAVREGYPADMKGVFTVTVPDAPEGYDPAVARGGGWFYLPAEGKITHQRKEIDPQMYSRLEAQINAKVAAGDLTEDEGREQRSDLVNDDRAYRTLSQRQYGHEKRHYRDAAALKRELERRRIAAKDSDLFPYERGEDGLYGLVPLAVYEQKKATERLNAKLREIGSAAVREDEGRVPETPRRIDEIGRLLREDKTLSPEESQALTDELTALTLQSTVGDKPVEVDSVAEDIVETQRLERDKKAQAEGRAETTDTSRRATPATEKADSQPPEEKAEPTQPSVKDVTDAEEPDWDLRKEITDEERQEIEDTLSEGELFKLGEALKLDEPPAPELPEPTDEPDLTDVKLEEPPEPPTEAKTKDTPAEDIPPAVDDSAVPPWDQPPEEEEEDTPSAEDIEGFAADMPGGFDYLKRAYQEFSREGYSPENADDRRRIQFLAEFLKEAGYPDDPEELKLVAKQAYDRLQTQLLESAEVARRRRQAILGNETLEEGPEAP